jgi:hypothetical protein
VSVRLAVHIATEQNPPSLEVGGVLRSGDVNRETLRDGDSVVHPP